MLHHPDLLNDRNTFNMSRLGYFSFGHLFEIQDSSVQAYLLSFWRKAWPNSYFYYQNRSFSVTLHNAWPMRPQTRSKIGNFLSHPNSTAATTTALLETHGRKSPGKRWDVKIRRMPSLLWTSLPSQQSTVPKMNEKQHGWRRQKPRTGVLVPGCAVVPDKRRWSPNVYTSNPLYRISLLNFTEQSQG